MEFCLETLQEAVQAHGTPEIFNTDQGAQFTSLAFTNFLKNHEIRISMDGKGRFRDYILIERLWWTVKYQYLTLHSFGGGHDLRRGLDAWFRFYNEERPHQALKGHTPNEKYEGLDKIIGAA